MIRSTQLKHTEPPLNDASIADSFESPDWYLKGYATNIQVRAETVSALTAGKRYTRILDIGCGDGSLSLPLVPRASHVTFLDRSSAMLKRVAERVGPTDASKVSYVNSGIMEADLGAKRFDLVLCVGVLAYVQDVGACLDRICAALVPDADLILECTHGSHILSRLAQWKTAATSWLKPRGFDAFTYDAQTVIAAAEARGLRLHRTFRYAYSLPIFSRFASGDATYRMIRGVYGDVNRNRRSSLGNQFLMHFRLSPL